MAVNSNNAEVKTVLEIDTTKSASSMKELRSQIKQLKDELVGLDQGTEEYQNTVVQLGEKMHQLKEINEEVRRTNSDFGDTLGNISNVMAGGVAAVQGLTAGLSLLGVEMGDDNKLTQTLVKSMALLQSLGSMDKAIKSFRALTVVLKSNIAAAGGLSKALKALAVSNPFTAILAAVVAVTAATVALVKAFQSAADAEKEMQMAAHYEELKRDLDETAVKLYNNVEIMKINGATDYEVYLKKKEVAKKLRDDAQRTYEHLLYLSTEGTRAERNAAEAQLEIWEQTYQQRQDDYQKLLDSWAVDSARETKRQEEAAKKAAEDAKKKRKEAADAAKAAREKQYKAEQDAYNHSLSLQKQAYQEQLEQAERVYQEQLELANGNAEAIEAAERQKASAVFRIDQDNYLKMIELAENYRKLVEARPNTDGSQTAQLDQLNETVQNLTISLNGCADAYRQLVREQTAADAETAYNKAAFEQRRKALEDDIALTQAHNERYLELIKQKWVLQADLDAEAIRYQQEQLTQDNTNVDAEMELLRQQFDAKLITQEEYDEKSLELEQRRLDNIAALNELEVEAEKNKYEKKKELQEMYMSAISSITGSITSVLNEAANAEDVSFEDQKKLKIASTIITTLEAGMLAMKDMMEAGGPWGVAAGAVAMASTIATGMMQVNKIRQTKKNSAGNASPSAGAMTTIQSPAQIVNLNAVNDQIELPDQRVYVVESDITDAQRRVEVVETNSEI